MMAEMSTPILGLKEKKCAPCGTQKVRSFPTSTLPPKSVFETGLFFDWLRSLYAVKVVSLAGFDSVVTLSGDRRSNSAVPFIRQRWSGRVTAAGGLE